MNNNNIEMPAVNHPGSSDSGADAGVATTADTLLVVDVQTAFIDGQDPVPESARLIQAVRLLVANARVQGALVVFLQNDGKPGTSDAPETPGWQLAINPQSGEPVIRKAHDDGFADTPLGSVLNDHGSRTLAVCGVMSEMCVAATVRGAMAHGYEVVLPHDGHATQDVPAGPGSEGVPARLASRAAEWSLGDQILIMESSTQVLFASAAR